MPESLLLDTCALIWLVGGSRKLKRKVRDQIDEAPMVYVSAISAWEISLKAARSELILPMPPESWFEGVLQAHDLVLAPLAPEVLMSANRLPWHHRDPADRFIIATAVLQRIPVVTGDKKFNNYDIRVVF
ncbi:MAG: type II toxin-antitoxin system VapC family toxin [Opitutales bacterium]|nr:type II toxin-antitoxin system VapC family toxin [Opitutales bacterium]